MGKLMDDEAIFKQREDMKKQLLEVEKQSEDMMKGFTELEEDLKEISSLKLDFPKFKRLDLKAVNKPDLVELPSSEEIMQNAKLIEDVEKLEREIKELEL